MALIIKARIHSFITSLYTYTYMSTAVHIPFLELRAINPLLIFIIKGNTAL
jgi:hypothetical protein